MAIDGVKIIDSDDGYDIYNCVVENYKDGVSVRKCRAKCRWRFCFQAARCAAKAATVPMRGKRVSARN